VKAVVFHEFGGLDVLKLEEVDDPQPGSAEVVLDVTASALNHLDVDIREGISRFPIEPPHILGVEVVGRVAETGSDVKGWQPGDRAMVFLMDVCKDCRYCRTGRESLCVEPGFVGFSTSGGYAQKIAVAAGHLVRLPDGVPDEEGAALQIAFATAWHMLFTRGRLRAGETVLINSVGSGVGSAAVQLARIGGATIIGTASTDEKLERAAELGMDHGINHREQDVVAEVMRLTDDQGVDLAYEHVGGDLFQNALDSLCKDGRLVTCGAHAGEVVPFDIIPFFRGQKSIIGSFVYNRDELERCIKLAQSGAIKPLVHKVFPLEEAREAMAMMERREHFGKIILKP
jgi:NADPH:quinone reductase-like Zn-dependent oxidoreductase